jgi:hypothetical protein
LQISDLLLASFDRMEQNDQPSEEFLDTVLALHNSDPALPPEDPAIDPAIDPEAAGSEVASSASTPDSPESPDPESPPAKKKKRSYATKKRMKSGTDTFTDSIDWMLARIRRARGDTYADIAADMGCGVQTLTARFSREGWAREIDALHEAAQARFESATNAAVSKLVEQGKSYREKMARASLVFADSVAKMNGPQLLSKAKDISSLNSVARQTLGLDQGDKESKTIVNIGFLSQLAEEQIDVQSRPLQRRPQECESGSPTESGEPLLALPAPPPV